MRDHQVLAHHDSVNGRITICAQDCKTVLFESTDSIYAGTKGVRRFHAIYNAIRKAETVAVAAALREQSASLREYADRMAQ